MWVFCFCSFAEGLAPPFGPLLLRKVCWNVQMTWTLNVGLLFFFCRGVGTFGPFVVMIYKMCSSDMVRFFIIFGIFVLQFGQGTTTSGNTYTIFSCQIIFLDSLFPSYTCISPQNRLYLWKKHAPFFRAFCLLISTFFSCSFQAVHTVHVAQFDMHCSTQRNPTFTRLFCVSFFRFSLRLSPGLFWAIFCFVGITFLLWLVELLHFFRFSEFVWCVQFFILHLFVPFVTRGIFCRSFHLTGPFVIVLYKILTTDIVKFGVIFSIFVVGFGAGTSWDVLFGR